MYSTVSMNNNLPGPAKNIVRSLYLKARNVYRKWQQL